jgi:hypothetical protein
MKTNIQYYRTILPLNQYYVMVELPSMQHDSFKMHFLKQDKKSKKKERKEMKKPVRVCTNENINEKKILG